MRKVAFTIIGGEQWKGGYNYLLNLLGALRQYQSDRLQACVLVGEDVSAQVIKDLSAIEGVEVRRHFCLNADQNMPMLARALLMGRDSTFQSLLDEMHVDVVFESARFFGWRLRQGTIAWFPDFQHRLMPTMFPVRAYWRRELGFWVQILSGRRLMVSSADAAGHFRALYHAGHRRLHVTKFSVPAGDTIVGTPVDTLRGKYGLPNQYFFLPNQFWRHKNHAVVIESLAILRGRGVEVVVVCTGAKSDPRAPAHFDGLMEQVKVSGLADSFRVLGLLPYADLVGLMSGARALINPSLFEGWSTPVEEARANGLPLLLSNIPVHREQAGDVALFFDPNSASELADQIERMACFDESSYLAITNKLRQSSSGRRRDFAAAFAAVVEQAAEDVQ
jgi:glycosyltransferase involved in cell wall biosynthesis